MEPNVWRIVQHIVFDYFSSSCWTECKHVLFNIFLNQCETVHRKLDREFISSSSFGVYTLVCQLCGVLDPLSSKNQSRESMKSLKALKSRKSTNEEKGASVEPEPTATDLPKAKSAELPLGQLPDDGFHLDRAKSEPNQCPDDNTETDKVAKPEDTSSTTEVTEQKEQNGSIAQKENVKNAENAPSEIVDAEAQGIADQSFLALDVEMPEISSSSDNSRRSSLGNDNDPEITTPAPRIHSDNVLPTKTTFTNEQLLLGLDWYFAVCRLEDLLTNKREDYLTPELYTLYQPVFDPLFRYLKSSDSDCDVTPLLERMVDDGDYALLTAKYEELQREEKRIRVDRQNGVSPKKKHHHSHQEDTFLSLLSRVISSCIAWICTELYYTYRMSEFFVLLTQLLADPGPFKSKLQERRSTRIIRLHQRFNLPSDQTFVNSFSCALDTGKFLHQGKIYFFKDYVSFYSNMLGMAKTQQKFLLPVTEIKLITRKATAWVFNNAIEIQMKDKRNFIFRTFMSRDSTFELLHKLISGQIEWHEIEKQQAEELEKEKEEELARLQKEEEREKERALKEKERALKEKERALKEKERERGILNVSICVKYGECARVAMLCGKA